MSKNGYKFFSPSSGSTRHEVSSYFKMLCPIRVHINVVLLFRNQDILCCLIEFEALLLVGMVIEKI